MFKLFKKIFKLAAGIIGLYAAFNTLVWAKVGISRAKRQTRLNWEAVKDLSAWEKCVIINTAVFDEMDEENEKFKEFTGKYN